MLSVSFNQISGFVRDICNQERFSVYYKKYYYERGSITSYYLPQHFETVSPRLCDIITNAMNSIFQY